MTQIDGSTDDGQDEGDPLCDSLFLSPDALQNIPRAQPGTTPGQIVYEAYVRHAAGVSLVSGQDLPAWHDMPDVIRVGWETGAAAVCLEQLARLMDQGLLPRSNSL